MFNRVVMAAMIGGLLSLLPASSSAKTSGVASVRGAVTSAKLAQRQMKNGLKDGTSPYDGAFSLSYGGFKNQATATKAAKAVRKLGLSTYVTRRDADGYSVVFSR